jgi:hypothetical protein
VLDERPGHCCGNRNDPGQRTLSGSPESRRRPGHRIRSRTQHRLHPRWRRPLLPQGTIDIASPVSAQITWGAGANAGWACSARAPTWACTVCDNRAYDRNQTVPPTRCFIPDAGRRRQPFPAAAAGYCTKYSRTALAAVCPSSSAKARALTKGAVREVLSADLLRRVIGSDLLLRG